MERCTHEDNVRPIYDHVYTSSVEFTVNRRCNVRFGPIAYITSDVGFDPCHANTRFRGPMQHKMLEGVYRVHRVRKRCLDRRGRQLDSEKLLTVITLHNLDPTKIVRSLERVTSVSQCALDNDVFFSNRRWMRFVGKTPIPDTSRDENIDLREHLRRQFALAAYTCRLFRSKIKNNQAECVLSTDDMVECDTNTFYVRLLSKPLTRELQIELSSPEMSEFTATARRAKTPSLVGISLPGSSDELNGHVFYSQSDLHGYALPTKRAFAVVIGPTTRSTHSAYGITFGSPVICKHFLYDGKNIEDIYESPSEIRARGKKICKTTTEAIQHQPIRKEPTIIQSKPRRLEEGELNGDREVEKHLDTFRQNSLETMSNKSWNIEPSVDDRGIYSPFQYSPRSLELINEEIADITDIYQDTESDSVGDIQSQILSASYFLLNTNVWLSGEESSFYYTNKPIVANDQEFNQLAVSQDVARCDDTSTTDTDSIKVEELPEDLAQFIDCDVSNLFKKLVFGGCYTNTNSMEDKTEVIERWLADGDIGQLEELSSIDESDFYNC